MYISNQHKWGTYRSEQNCAESVCDKLAAAKSVSAKVKDYWGQIIKEWRACQKAVIQTGMVMWLAAAAVIHYPYRSGRWVLPHRVVRDVVIHTILTGLGDKFNEAPAQLLCKDLVVRLQQAWWLLAKDLVHFWHTARLSGSGRCSPFQGKPAQ